MMDGLDVRLRHVRKQPVQQRLEEARGMFVGMRVADAEKITAIQNSTGSQNLRNARNLSMTDENRIVRSGAIRM